MNYCCSAFEFHAERESNHKILLFLEKEKLWVIPVEEDPMKVYPGWVIKHCPWCGKELNKAETGNRRRDILGRFRFKK